MFTTGARKPLLRWAGSKKRQAGQYAAYFPRSFDSYVEPFAGSASFCFALGLARPKLNDINAALINFYWHARERPERLWTLCGAIERSAKTYYEVRKLYNKCRPSFQKAVLFYYVNRNCFNGIYRVNKLGEFNVPFSDQRVSPYLTLPDFVSGADLLREARLSSLDFEAFCLREVAAGDFVFLDPPYAAGNTKGFHHYDRREFSADDLERLSNLLDDLDAGGAKFMLSFPEGLLPERLKRWNRAGLQIRRTVAGQAAFRGMAEEVLVFNYDT